MSKKIQFLYALRDFAYTLTLAVFGWTLTNFPFLIAKPLEAVGSFFTYAWTALYSGITLIAYAVEIAFLPGRLHPIEEIPAPWRRWKGMLMEANLVPGIFCDHFGVMQMSQGDIIRYVGIFLYLLSIGLTIWYGTYRQKQIDAFGENSISTRGIYNKVRFPQYLAQCIYSLAVALIFKSWLALVATFLLVLYVIRYTRKLDGVMEKKYKHEWSAYRLNSKRVFPFIY
jgi:protein-S-isoprenylcysteine O-methyltransferase Ste14